MGCLHFVPQWDSFQKESQSTDVLVQPKTSHMWEERKGRGEWRIRKTHTSSQLERNTTVSKASVNALILELRKPRPRTFHFTQSKWPKQVLFPMSHVTLFSLWGNWGPNHREAHPPSANHHRLETTSVNTSPNSDISTISTLLEPTWLFFWDLLCV
jgi:hypothetical protein